MGIKHLTINSSLRKSLGAQNLSPNLPEGHSFRQSGFNYTARCSMASIPEIPIEMCGKRHPLSPLRLSKPIMTSSVTTPRAFTSSSPRIIKVAARTVKPKQKYDKVKSKLKPVDDPFEVKGPIGI